MAFNTDNQIIPVMPLAFSFPGDAPDLFSSRQGVSGESIDGDNVLSGSSKRRGPESGKELTEVSSKEIVVHTNAGPTLMAISLWPCLQVSDKTSFERMISSDQKRGDIQICSHEPNQEGILKGCQFEIGRAHV